MILKNIRTRKIFKSIIIIAFCVCIVALSGLLIINSYIKNSTNERIIILSQTQEVQDVDCIIVLGCQVKSDGTLSHMLQDRLIRGLEVYNLGAAPKLLMSGDHGTKNYNEVGAMKAYAVENGVPSEDVFMDHAGFSTYETIYRAKEVFGADKVIIVTQRYHLHRALYIAEELGVEAYGVSSDLRTYAGQWTRNFREVLARNKDFIKCILKSEPTYLGNTISVSGNGNITNDN